MINDNPKAVLSWTQYDDVLTHEFSGSDVTVNDVLQAVYGLLVGAGFDSTCILDEMYAFANEKLHVNEESDEYENN